MYEHRGKRHRVKEAEEFLPVLARAPRPVRLGWPQPSLGLGFLACKTGSCPPSLTGTP